MCTPESRASGLQSTTQGVPSGPKRLLRSGANALDACLVFGLPDPQAQVSHAIVEIAGWEAAEPRYLYVGQLRRNILAWS